MANKNHALVFAFDVDGCVLDSFRYFMDFLPKIFEKFDLEVDQELVGELQEEITNLLAGKTSKILIIKLINHAAKRMGLGLVKRIKFIIYLKKLYKQNILDVGLIPGTMEIFKDLKSRGHYVTLFTSGSRKDFNLKFQNKQDLFEFVDAYVVRDEVKKMKPDPEGLYLLFNKIGIDSNKPRVVMIGDMTHDMEVVKDLKQALSIGVLSGVNNKEELEDAGADFVFESINDLIDNIGAIESYFE